MRLEGTNVDNAKAIIENSGLAITSATDLDDGSGCLIHYIYMFCFIMNIIYMMGNAFLQLPIFIF